MILLSATNLTKNYGITPILTGVSFHINKGDRIGIVGVNGAGKSTLLNILTGELRHDEGDFFLAAETTIGYLKQRDNFAAQNTVYEEMLAIFRPVIDLEGEIKQLSEEIASASAKGQDVEKQLHRFDDLSVAFQRMGGYSYKSEINGILSSMAFTADFYGKQISLLSGGERTRLALAALLLKKPDLLLLDEPTNHLDIGTLKWLEQYLKSYTGTIVLISHDRYFLDQTTNRIFEIENHSLLCYEGNYSTFAEKKKSMLADAMKKYETQQKEIEKQEDIIRRFKERGTEKLAKRAQSREKRLSHVEVLNRPEVFNGKLKIRFKEGVPSGTDVLLAEDLSKSFGIGAEKHQLFEHVSFDVKRGDRICMVGPNGVGKTSLLKIIMGDLEKDNGYLKIGHNVIFGYYDQEQQLLNDTCTVLEELHNTYRLYTQTELRSMLGRFLFKGEDVFKTVASLSGGEKARLSLLKIMMSGSNVLLMDEPTNHLDIASKEVFEDALLEFPGTIFVVSHDRYFLNKIPTKILELSEVGMTSFVGGYHYYLDKKDSIVSGKSYLADLSRQTSSTAGGSADLNHSANEKERRAEERRATKEQQAGQRRKERQLQTAEAEIASLEETIQRLEAQLCLEEIYTDFEKSTTISGELEKSKTALEVVYEQWLSLQEEEIIKK